MQTASTKPKNKTLATSLAVLLGGTGAHRFYLYGAKDFFAWNYVIAFVLFVVAQFLVQSEHPTGIGVIAYFPVAILVGWAEAFVIGLTTDKRWDAIYNRGLTYQSQSGWPIKILLGLALLASVGTVLFSIIHIVRLIIKSGIIG
tara:strand:+ start:870727 stop:871158 length:432 start_codon:yes stop_codon:yes gene_type:complete